MHGSTGGLELKLCQAIMLGSIPLVIKCKYLLVLIEKPFACRVHFCLQPCFCSNEKHCSSVNPPNSPLLLIGGGFSWESVCFMPKGYSGIGYL